MSDAEKPKPIGYKSPPEDTRFKPGQSGNPKGRPKGAHNFKTDVKATLETTIDLATGGAPKKISTQKAALLRLREKALKGDQRALDRLLSLAQTFNNEPNSSHAALSQDDAKLLEIYRKRILAGASEDSGTEERT
jgi:hypothetical protein